MIVGIDLGTTNSLVAHLNLGKPEVIPGEDGDKLVPSVVSLAASEQIIVGNQARRLLIDAPERWWVYCTYDIGFKIFRYADIVKLTAKLSAEIFNSLPFNP